MESKKENPMGMCEKLFNAFNVNNSAFRPLRRLTFKNPEPPTTTTPNQSPPNKQPPQVLENNHNNPIFHDHHQQHHDTPSLIPPKTTIDQPLQIPTSTPPPPKKSLDAVQVQVPSKIEIENQQAQQKVPVNTPKTGKSHRSTTTKKEEAPPPPTTTTVPTPVAPKVVVVAPQAPQVQLPVPTPPAPATVAGRRQPQRLVTKNVDGKTDDFINRVRNKLRNGSNVGKVTSN